MSRSSTLILLGVLTILTPFSGLPVAVRSLLAVIFGGFVFGIGLTLRTREAQRAQVPTTETSAPEPVPPQEISPI